MRGRAEPQARRVQNTLELDTTYAAKYPITLYLIFSGLIGVLRHRAFAIGQRTALSACVALSTYEPWQATRAQNCIICRLPVLQASLAPALSTSIFTIVPALPIPALLATCSRRRPSNHCCTNHSARSGQRHIVRRLGHCWRHGCAGCGCGCRCGRSGCGRGIGSGGWLARWRSLANARSGA